MNDENVYKHLRKKITSGSIPIHIIFNGKDYFKICNRFSYFDALATSILKSDLKNFQFFYGEKLCDDKYSIGVCFDVMGCKNLPFTLMLRSFDKDTSRRDIFSEHLNSIKFAEYLEKEKLEKTVNLSKFNHNSITNMLMTEDFLNTKTMSLFYNNPYFIKCQDDENEIDTKTEKKIGNNNNLEKDKSIENNDLVTRLNNEKNRLKCIATRYHFKDGTTIVVKTPENSRIFGICQGILLPNIMAKDAYVLKDIDNWLHISFSNATSTALQEYKSKKITIVFRPIGGTKIIKDSTIIITITSKVHICENYLKEKLCFSKRVFLYLEGLFLIDPEEYLFNISMSKEKITISYSLVEAWI